MFDGVKRAVALVCALAFLGGCGGDDGGSAQNAAAGKKVFTDAGCGGCHTLADAGSSGQVGPDLDQLAPSTDTVAEQVKRGGPGMPAFEGKLSADEIDAVADYVSSSASGSAGSGGKPVGVQFEPDDTKLASCSGAEDFPCFEQAFGNLVYNEGPKPALTELENKMRADRAVALGCHRIAHRMGSAALKKYDDDVGLAFSKGTAVCSSGYYHGILERAFTGVPKDELGPTARKLCATKSIADDGFLRFQCNHGLGHGLMITTRYELPLSLDTCDELGGSYDTDACDGGVFMENFTSSYGIASGYLKKDDLIYPCNDVSDARKPACYLIVTSNVLPQVGWNWKKAAEVCNGAEPDWIYMCFRSYGRDAISTSGYDQDEARRLCGFAGTYQADCHLSVAEHIVNEERRLDGGGHYCQETEKILRMACFAGVGTTGQLVIPDVNERTAACRRFTRVPAEVSACVTGQFDYASG
jgi:mono/diheme cytochrome c family protein